MHSKRSNRRIRLRQSSLQVLTTKAALNIYFRFLYNFSMSTILVVRGMTPWYNFDFLYNHTPLGKDYRRSLNILRHFTDQVSLNVNELSTRLKPHKWNITYRQVVKTRRQELTLNDNSIITDENGDKSKFEEFNDSLILLHSL